MLPPVIKATLPDRSRMSREGSKETPSKKPNMVFTRTEISAYARCTSNRSVSYRFEPNDISALLSTQQCTQGDVVVTK